MKIALACISLTRITVWLSLIVWTIVVAMFVILGLCNTTSSAITEAAVATIGCVCVFLPYAVARSLDAVCERVENLLKEFGSRKS